MSDDMMVQQRPSTVPYYALGGAALGAAAGAALTKWTNFNIATKYASNPDEAIDLAMQEMVEQTNAKDRFVHQMVERDKSPDSAWKTLEDVAAARHEAEAEYMAYFENAPKAAEDLGLYAVEFRESEIRPKEALEDLLTGRKKLGEEENIQKFIDSLLESKAEGDQKTVTDAFARFREANENATFNFGGKDNVKLAEIPDEKLPTLKEFKDFIKQDEDIIAKAKESKQYKDNVKTFLDTLLESKAEKDVKAVDDVLEKFKEKYKNESFNIGEGKTKKLAELSDAKIKTLEEFKDMAMTNDSVRKRAEELPQYKEVVDKVKGTIKKRKDMILDKNPDFNFENFERSCTKYRNALDKANKELTEEVVAKCKTPRYGLTMLAGAGILALAGAIIGKFANKNKDK